MIEEGVLEKYPVDAVYGMHNWPEMPVGQFAIQSGPMMAAFDIFEITIKGRGAMRRCRISRSIRSLPRRRL